MPSSGPARGAACAGLLCTPRFWRPPTAAGVKFVHGDVGEVTQDAESVRVGELRARYLAAADGLHSPIRRSLGLAVPCGGPRRWGIRRHVQIAPWTDHVEVHWAPGAEAYVTPVADDCVGIAILTSRRGGFDSHLAKFAALGIAVARPSARPGPGGGSAAAEGSQPSGGAGAAGG